LWFHRESLVNSQRFVMAIASVTAEASSPMRLPANSHRAQPQMSLGNLNKQPALSSVVVGNERSGRTRDIPSVLMMMPSVDPKNSRIGEERFAIAPQASTHFCILGRS
jgi:hypothetical protein